MYFPNIFDVHSLLKQWSFPGSRSIKQWASTWTSMLFVVDVRWGLDFLHQAPLSPKPPTSRDICLKLLLQIFHDLTGWCSPPPPCPLLDVQEITKNIWMILNKPCFSDSACITSSLESYSENKPFAWNPARPSPKGKARIWSNEAKIQL